MKAKILLPAVFIAVNFAAFSQVPGIEWEKCYGGSYNDGAHYVIQTSDGGYAVAGFSSSMDGNVTANHGLDDYWITKLDINGNIIWQNSFGGSQTDQANSIVQTVDGGYAVSGVSFSNDGDVTNHHGGTVYPDYWIVKLDANGNMQWQKSLGGSGEDAANSIIQTKDSGYAVAGYTTSTDGDVIGNNGATNFWIVKLDFNGDIQWQMPLGGSQREYAQAIIQTMDGGYALAGYSNSEDGDVTGHHGGIDQYDYWIVKLDTTGNITWEQSFGGSKGESAYAIVQTNEGGYAIAGQSQSDDGDVTGNHHVEDYWIVNIDSAGSLIWEKSLGGFENEIAYSIVQSNDGGFVIAGATESEEGDISGNHQTNYFTPDYWIVKLDESGNLMWQECLGGEDYENAYSIVNSSDGGHVIAGIASSYGGDVTGNHGGPSDFWIVKLFPEVTGIIQLSTPAVSIYPNPSTGIFEIESSSSSIQTAEVFNLPGKKVFSTSIQQPSTSNKVDLTSQPDGIYFLHLATEYGLVVKKVVISR